MLTKDAIIERYPNGFIEWYMPIEWHVFGSYRLHGQATQYYPTGEVKLTRTYDHGLETGEEIMYYKDGSVMSRLPFKDGMKDGLHVFTHPDGSREEVTFEAGELKRETAKKFDKNGKEKVKKNESTDGSGNADSKKILPGDYVPAALARKSVV
jgi:antitoxin component YwqK of YwqJK toxin-antitoxin module